MGKVAPAFHEGTNHYAGKDESGDQQFSAAASPSLPRGSRGDAAACDVNCTATALSDQPFIFRCFLWIFPSTIRSARQRTGADWSFAGMKKSRGPLESLRLYWLQVG